MKKLDPNHYHDNPCAIAEFLSEALKTNKLHSILDAIKSVLLAQNVTALSEATGIRRESLYRSFSGKVDPPLSRVLSLFDGLDVRLEVKPLVARKERPPRPKPGRPRSSARRVVKKL